MSSAMHLTLNSVNAQSTIRSVERPSGINIAGALLRVARRALFAGAALTLSLPALAYTQWEWQSVGYIENSSGSVVTAGPQGTYSTQAQAFAALPRTASWMQVITQFDGARRGSNGQVDYHYIAPPVEVSYGAWSYTAGSLGGCGVYASESSLLDCLGSYFQSQTCPPGATATMQSVSIWTPQPSDTQQYETGSSQVNAPACSTNNWNVGIQRRRDLICPSGYNVFQGGCANNYSAVVRVGAMECPATGPSPLTGNPCNVATGDKALTETDYRAPGIEFSRCYHSAIASSGTDLGFRWTHSYSAKLLFTSISKTTPSILVRQGGGHEILESDNGIRSVSGSGTRLLHVGSEWHARLSNGDTEVYDAAGELQRIVSREGAVTTLNYGAVAGVQRKLASVVGPYGHRLDFEYVNGRVDSVATSDGTTIHYEYDVFGNLTKVTFQDGTNKRYLYEDVRFPNHLTGIVDESGVRYSTYSYDSIGRVATSEHAGGAGRIALTYNSNNTVVEDSAGLQTTYTFNQFSTRPRRITSVASAGATDQYQLGAESQRRVTRHIDRRGVSTDYTYDAEHMLTLTEAVGTARERKSTFTYLAPEDDLVTLESVSTPAGSVVREVATAYNAQRLPSTIMISGSDGSGGTASRTIQLAYATNGRVETIDGPRSDVSDVTTYAYNNCDLGGECGQVHSITNSAGHSTTYSNYDPHGQPTRIVDPNGLATSLGYDLRLRLVDRCIGGTLPGCVGGELTHIDYWPTGLVKKVTEPDGSFVEYVYDAAHRLIEVKDDTLSRIVYTRDAMGNATNESVYDPSNTVRRIHARVYNTLNQLWKEVNAGGTASVTTTFGYDANGNQTSVSAPLGRGSTSLYDELNRLSQVNDAASGLTQFGYNANDDLVSFRDPLGLITAYNRNGFGESTSTSSPDSGNSADVFDPAGNVKISTDARGAVATRTYDSLNRMTLAQFAGVPIPVARTYSYDTCANGIGRLCQMTDPTGTTSWSYNGKGRVASKTHQVPVGGSLIQTYQVQYGYNSAGQLTSMTYPSGTVVTYSYANGRVTAISLTADGATQSILTNATYDPFGAVKAWTWGNGTTAIRSTDLDGRPSVINTGALWQSYQYDDASRIIGITDHQNSSLSWAYGYDLLDRLTSATKPGTNLGYQYDANGNRTTQTGTAYGSPHTYFYEEPRTSNKLLHVDGVANGPGGPYAYSVRNFDHDARGNAYPVGQSYQYDAANRLRYRGQNFWVNGLEQRTRREWTAAERHSAFDEDGRLLGQYDSFAAFLPPAFNNFPTETVWLGNLPVAVVYRTPVFESDSEGSYVAGISPAKLLYAHADHLGAPRRLSKPADNSIAWRWDSDPFGNGTALGELEYTLRFPGQMFDLDQGITENWHREYDSQLGRYLQSDPIGLLGGLNTYAYVGARPLQRIDRFGLAWGDMPPNPPGFNRENWLPGRFSDGTAYWEAPDRTRWIPHREDIGHWRHWDKIDKDGNDQGRWPPNSKKMWPLQKKPKKDQCEDDPSGDSPQGDDPDSYAWKQDALEGLLSPWGVSPAPGTMTSPAPGPVLVPELVLP